MKNISLILQREPTECALACLAMILNSYNSNLDLNTLRQRFTSSLRGTSLADFIKMAHACKLSTKVYYLGLEELMALQHACILFWNNNHYVVFAGVSKSRIKIYDPALGYQEYAQSEFMHHFNGLVLTLTPASDYLPLVSMSSCHLLKQLLQSASLSYSIKRLSSIIGLTLVLQAALLCYPSMLEYCLATSLVTSSFFVIVLCFIKFSEAVIYFVRALLLSRTEKIFHHYLYSSIVTRLFSMPHQYFLNRTLASVSTRFAILDKVKQLIHCLSIGLIDGVLSLTLLIILFLHQVAIGCWVLMCSIIYFCIHFCIHKTSVVVDQLQANAKSTEICYLQESIRGLHSIKSANKHLLRIKNWLQLVMLAKKYDGKQNQLQASLETTRMFLFGMIQIGVLAYLDNKTYSLVFYIFLYTRTITECAQKGCDLLQLRSMLHQFSDLIYPKQISPITYVTNTDALLTLRNISFQYDESSSTIFRNLNLQIKHGDFLLIQGNSGSGKSTLMKIMLGMLMPACGSVVRRESLQLATVLQEDVLFSGTILENIALSPEANPLEVMEAARLVELHEFIESLPMGYHTYLTPEVQHISGGQKQRVLLARALYHKPQLLFLDEACSMLDLAAEQRIYAAIKQQGIACVIISHRPDTANIADNVFIIQS